MPGVVNHWIFTAFVNLSILQVVVYQVVKTRTFVINKELLLENFAPVVRLELLVFYFFVVFHKLNSGFFTPEVSCATEFLTAQDSTGVFIRNWRFLALNAHFTIVVETLIPILLIFRKTRYLGLLIGLVFHCLLGFNPKDGFYDFSSMIFATYLLFTTDKFTTEVYCLYKKLLVWKNNFKNRLTSFSFSRLGGVVMLIFIVFGLLLVFVKVVGTGDFFRDFFWTAFNLVFIIPFLFAMLRTKNGSVERGKNIFRVPSWTLLIFPVLVFLNGFSPYLGLKTENSFAMFSNLRTEGGKSNHYLIPASAQIFDYQNDLVEVISSSDSMLTESATKKEFLVFFAFKNYVQIKKPARIEYVRNGARMVFEYKNPVKHNDLMVPDSKLLRKLMSFRAISKSDPAPCYH